MKFLLVDDHVLFSNGLSMMVKNIFSDSEVKEARSLEIAEAYLQQQTFDLIFLDIFFQGTHNLLAWEKFLINVKNMPVCVLTASHSKEHVQRAFELGVSGYLHKSVDMPSMIAAIKQILSGQIYYPDDYLSGANPSNALSSITSRQKEILFLLEKGKSNKEIATELDIVESTVKRHLHNIFQRIGANNRVDAIRIIHQSEDFFVT